MERGPSPRPLQAIGPSDFENPAGRVLVLSQTGFPILPDSPWGRPNLDYYLVRAGDAPQELALWGV